RGVRHGPQLLLGDAGRVFDDLDRPARTVDDRIVGRLDPDVALAFGDALELGGVEFASVQRCPELPIGGMVAFCRGDKHRMGLARDLGKLIA
ncbi:hypothetical protein FE79_15030, partial [Staphylococcus aureus]